MKIDKIAKSDQKSKEEITVEVSMNEGTISSRKPENEKIIGGGLNSKSTTEANETKKKKYRLRSRSSVTAKAHRG
eukprot:TRINITY_DN8301_c0_g1_i1.p3 TRINITY_DN8301_c0_g1~~TRINITY_DN8301_c0_g1_i1.p3  ORF type:complete len:75 (+),score=32.96 TRINITY_DN8301_c0_g1_i1:717-941(+)